MTYPSQQGPRKTRFMQKRMRQLADVFLPLHTDAQIRAAWAHATERLAALHNIAIELVDPTLAPAIAECRARVGESLEAAFAHYEETVRERAPDLGRILGPHLRRYLWAICLMECGLEVPDTLLPQRTHLLSPEYPITLPPDGRPHHVPQAKRRHLLALHSYFAAFH